MVACKAEQSRVKQIYEQTPEEFCKANSIPPPQFFSSVDLPSGDLYSTLATMAAHPYVHVMYYLHIPEVSILKI